MFSATCTMKSSLALDTLTMFEILHLLSQSGRTIGDDLQRWFAPYGPGAAFYIISDYCVGDPRKNHDVYAFEIILNHDRLENISDYILAVAPRDLKSSRKASEGLGKYITCPVAFSVSFVVSRETQGLRSYATADAIAGFVPEARRVVGQWITNSPEHSDYLQHMDRRLKLLGAEMTQKRRNDKLIRQIFLVATFAAYIFELLDLSRAPAAVRWISDRDAMFDRHDGLAFDLAFFFWLVVRSDRWATSPPIPRLSFASPGMDGKTEYAELIRLPDYLAGTLADVALPEMVFSHDKFPPLFSQLFVDSSNNAVVQVLQDGEVLTTRRVLFGKPRSAWQPLQQSDRMTVEKPGE